MNLPLSLRIGLKYVRAKRHNRFISFISAASTIGIALGVSVLITVMSVMNGFDQQIREKIFSLADQVTVSNYRNQLSNWQTVSKDIAQEDLVHATAPFVDGQALLSYSGEMVPVLLKGIVPELQQEVADLEAYLQSGQLSSLDDEPYSLFIGDELAQRLQVQLGDKITVMSPQYTASPVGAIPSYKRFTLKGIFHFGSKMGYDQGLAFIHLRDAQKLYNMGDAVSGLRIKVGDLYDAPLLKDRLKAQFASRYAITDWTERYGHFFAAIQMEKTMMFLIMLLIIAIASFNLVSMQVMLVTDKQAEIAILRTLGAKRSTIMKIFMVQGCTIGLLGVGLGILLGVELSWHAPDVIRWLESIINHHFVNEKVYWINHLPSKLDVSDVTKVSVITFILTFLATLYPSLKAAKILPAQALRYES